MDKIWDMIIKSLLKRGMVYGSDDIDLTFEQDGMKVRFTASNVKIKVSKSEGLR